MPINIHMGDTALYREDPDLAGNVMYLTATICMIVGVQAIKSEKDAVEFERRIRFYNEGLGKLWVGDFDYLALVPRLVGLHTNASRMTRVQFAAHMKKLWSEREYGWGRTSAAIVAARNAWFEDVSSRVLLQLSEVSA